MEAGIEFILAGGFVWLLGSLYILFCAVRFYHLTELGQNPSRLNVWKLLLIYIVSYMVALFLIMWGLVNG